MKFSPRLSPESMDRAVGGFNRIINRIPRSTQETIKSLYIFAVFLLTIGGAVLGVIKGRESAEVKSAPIIRSTNETFEIDIKREREGGGFSDTLDSEMINEMRKIDPDKVRFPSRVSLEPEADRGIIEADERAKVRETPGMAPHEPVLEGEYRDRPRIDSDVRPLERKAGPPEDDGAVLERERNETGPLQYEGARIERETRDGGTGPAERKRIPRGEDIRGPRQLQHEEGILGN